MTLPKKMWVNGVIVASSVVVVCAVAFAGYQYYDYKKALGLLKTDELKTIYTDALDRQAKLDKELTFDTVISAAFKWKSLGDATQHHYFYRKALAAYEEGVTSDDARSSLFFLNAGNILKSMGKYDDADDQYLQAIELDPGNEANHIARIEMYMYWEGKTQDDVLYVIDEASKIVLANGNINLLKGDYLSMVGRYEEALRTYEALLVVYGNTSSGPAIKIKVEELRRKIQQLK